jgi:hypothetical protein
MIKSFKILAVVAVLGAVSSPAFAYVDSESDPVSSGRYIAGVVPGPVAKAPAAHRAPAARRAPVARRAPARRSAPTEAYASGGYVGPSASPSAGAVDREAEERWFQRASRE